MTSPEFNPDAHEEFVRSLHADRDKSLGKYALFEEVMRHVDEGKCTFDEAIANYKHDLIHDTDPQP